MIMLHCFTAKNVLCNWERFDITESQLYLQSRGLKDDSRLAIVIEKSKGNPFILALFADIIKGDPNISAAQLAEIHNPEIAYLIIRIVDRIPNKQLRGLLRYRVVPRSLTFEFVEQVMAPYLLKIWQNEFSIDNPTADNVIDALQDKNRFTADDTSEDLETLWQAFNTYASDYSWVSRTSDTLTFQPDVRMPMQRLLLAQSGQGRNIYTALHQDAAKYFKDKSQSDPTQRGRWLREAVYHKFYSLDADANDFWFELKNEVHESPRDVIVLADELLDVAKPASDALDPPITTIESQTLATAYYELSYHHIPETHVIPIDQQPSIADWVAQVRFHDPHAVYISPAQLAYIESCLALSQRNIQRAQDLCEAHYHQPSDEWNGFELASVYLDILEAYDELDHTSFRKALANAEQAANALPNGTYQAAAERKIKERAAAYYAAYQQYEHATDLYETLLTSETNDAETTGRYAINLMQVYLEMGQDRQAIAICQRVLSSSAPQTNQADAQLQDQWNQFIQVETDLIQNRPDQAEQKMSALSIDSNLPNAREAGFRLRNYRARIAAAYYDIPTAITEWEAIAHGLPPGQRQVTQFINCARLYSEIVGDFNHAQRFLHRAQQANQDRRATFDLTLFESQMLIARGRANDAKQLLRPILEQRQTLSTAAQLQMLIVNLAADQDAELSTLHHIHRTLLDVPSKPWRLALMKDLRLHSPVSEVAAEEYGPEVLALLPQPEEGRQDPAVASLRLADVHRVFRKEATARNLLQNSIELTGKPLRLTLRHQVYQAFDRLGWLPEDLQETTFTQERRGWRMAQRPNVTRRYVV